MLNFVQTIWVTKPMSHWTLKRGCYEWKTFQYMFFDVMKMWLMLSFDTLKISREGFVYIVHELWVQERSVQNGFNASSQSKQCTMPEFTRNTIKIILLSDRPLLSSLIYSRHFWWKYLYIIEFYTFFWSLFINVWKLFLNIIYLFFYYNKAKCFQLLRS